MAHFRTRYALPLIENALKLSPLVGLVGHRQVGKTTLLETIGSAYHVLDTREAQLEASEHPAEYLRKRAGRRVVLDECQTVPALFPELKEWVRTHKTPGQFLLSGSVRFSSREAIRESLTGRIINIELLPLTLSETLELARPRHLVRLIEAGRFHADQPHPNRSVTAKKTATISRFLEFGGLPSVCFLRDDRQRGLRIQDQLMTILDRDLRLVRRLNVSLTDIRALVAALADLQGLPLDYTELRSRTGISTPTIKKIVMALEAVFVIRLLPIEGAGSRGTVAYFEDLAERAHLSARTLSQREKFAHFCFHELRSQLQYEPGMAWSVTQYRTRGGALIPFVFRAQGVAIGVIPLESPEEIEESMGSVRSFLSRHAEALVLGLHPGTGLPRVLNSRTMTAPISHLV